MLRKQEDTRNTEEQENLARVAEDEGKEVYVEWHPEVNVSEDVEIDGEEKHNEEYDDEVRDAYWAEDAYRVAERYVY